jgi:2-iminobutanoate/2-iminopropanoate deaminase
LVLSNLEAILKAGGCTFADVVRSTIFLIDLGDFAAVNAVYSEKFTAPFPARVTIQVAALPRGSKVEIDAIALIPS